MAAGWTDDPFAAMEQQEAFQQRYTGGTVFHLYVGERISSPRACKELVRRALTRFRIPYLTVLDLSAARIPPRGASVLPPVRNGLVQRRAERNARLQPAAVRSVDSGYGLLSSGLAVQPGQTERVPGTALFCRVRRQPPSVGRLMNAPTELGREPAGEAASIETSDPEEGTLAAVSVDPGMAFPTHWPAAVSTPSANASDPIPVAGLTALTTVDYPDRLAAVVFTQGCPWRCAYCHNAPLRPLVPSGRGSWNKVLRWLEARRGLLEAVVFSGGEPTLHSRLWEAARAVRRLGYLVGLHTAGMYPGRLARLLPWLDWVGLDIKAPFDERYGRLTGDPRAATAVRASLGRLMTSGVAFQTRTTVAPGPSGERDWAAVRRQLRVLGAPDPVAQAMRETGVRSGADRNRSAAQTA